MKADKPNKSIEEIFREKFQDFEHTPDKGFWPRFEKKLRVREFFRFNPGKFNIFYLGALVAGITAISMALIINKEDRAVALNDSTAIEVLEPTNKIVNATDIVSEEKQLISKGSALASAKVITVSTDDAKAKEDEDINRRVEVLESLEIDTNDAERQHIVAENERKISPELIKPAPIASFSIDKVSGCVPLTVSFKNLSLNYDSCMWEFGDGGYSTEKEPVWIFDEEGGYNVKLLVFGDNNKSASSTRDIIVYPLPVARFEVSTGDPLIPDEQLKFYNYSENSVKWIWDFGDGEGSYDFEPMHIYERYDSYSVKLIAISEHGCIDSLVITNAFGENSCFLKFPNAFIPNEGGPTGGYYSSRTDIESEVFHPVWSGVTDYNLRIFTRSGLMIFETDDINIGWDGYYKGQKADPGVYIWKVRGVFKNGDPFVQGGDITLLPKR